MQRQCERNGAIVGLLVFLGTLQGGELQKPEKSYVNLNRETNYLPSTARSNSQPQNQRKE
jgi:hypothetical protein